MRHRRTMRTLRRHLWLSGSIATLCFAGVAVVAAFVPLLLSIGRGEPTGSGAADPARDPGFVLHWVTWPLVPFALIASVVTGNVLFQRMREPLVRFVRCYEAIAAGAVPPQLAIRATDYLAEEADALNGMIAALRRRQTVRNEAVARLEEAIGDLAAHDVPESVLSELQDVAKRLTAPQTPYERDASTHRDVR